MVDLGYVKTGQDYGKQLAGFGSLIKEHRDAKSNQAGNVAMEKAVKSGDLTELMKNYPEHGKKAKEFQDLQETLKLDGLASMWEGATEALSLGSGTPETWEAKKDFLRTRRHRLNDEGKSTLHTEEALTMDTEEELDASLKNAITLAERRGAVDSLGANGGQGKFSSKATHFKDGSVLQGNPAGGSNFYDPSGTEMPVGSDERKDAMKSARASGVQYEYDKSFKSKMGEQDARLDTEPEIQRAIAISKYEGKTEAEDKDVIQRMKTNLPSLRQSVQRLKSLSAAASFSLPDKAYNAMMNKVFGIETKGGTARARMNSIADNMVLPLLKATFGAAFTVEEGKKLRAALVDENATPNQKMAQLEEFMNQKVIDLQGKMSKYATTDSGQVSYPENTIIKKGQQRLIMKGGQWTPMGDE